MVREQAERQLAHDVADRYAQTIKISQARFKAGDISEAELRKIELEGLRYQNAVIDAEMQLDVARSRLAALLGLASARAARRALAEAADAGARPGFDLPRLTARALERRPDLRAAGAARVAGRRGASRRPQRDALPDITLGAAYTHSDFTASGDNPNTLGLSLSLPLPLFDRNQANIGRAQLDQRRADNDGERLRHRGRARRRRGGAPRGARGDAAGGVRAPAGDDVPGTPTGTSDKGGMLARAETALRVAEKSYRAGAIALHRAARGAAHLPGHARAVPARALRLPPGSRRRLTRRRRAMTVSPRVIAACRRRGAVRVRRRLLQEHTARPKRAGAGEKPRDFIRYDPNHAPHDFIKIETVQEASGATSISLPGRVGFDEDHTQRVASPIDGRAVAILVKLGDRVRAGQPLVQLSSPNVGLIQADAQKALVGPDRVREGDRARAQAAGGGRGRRQGGRAGRRASCARRAPTTRGRRPS